MLNMSDRPFFGDLPLHDVTSEFSEDGLRQRLSYEISQSGWDDETRELLRQAEEIAIEAHQDDDRGIHPYSTHFLRVTIRIISPAHLGVKNDSDLLIAALLHDTVEDRKKFYVGFIDKPEDVTYKDHAIRVIAELFGERVAGLVRAVTNPDIPSHITDREERYELYRKHVREVLTTDEPAGIIKLSDFIDNCGGLAHNESPELALKLAGKYLPLIPDFYVFVNESTLLPEDQKPYLLAQLERAENLCLDLLEAG